VRGGLPALLPDGLAVDNNCPVGVLQVYAQRLREAMEDTGEASVREQTDGLDGCDRTAYVAPDPLV
jgi:hypothetical protein